MSPWGSLMTYEQSRNTISFPWEKDYLGSKDSSKEIAIEPGAPVRKILQWYRWQMMGVQRRGSQENNVPIFQHVMIYYIVDNPNVGVTSKEMRGLIMTLWTSKSRTHVGPQSQDKYPTWQLYSKSFASQVIQQEVTEFEFWGLSLSILHITLKFVPLELWAVMLSIIVRFGFLSF